MALNVSECKADECADGETSKASDGRDSQYVMQRKMMDFATLWLPIIGGFLLGSVAVAEWYSGNKIVALWFGFAGVICFLLLATLQIQNILQASPTEGNRPYLSIASLAFPDIVVKPGPVVVLWQIKCGGAPATISEANMTLWFDTKATPIPDKPVYRPNVHALSGITLDPGEVYNANLKSDVSLTPETVLAINAGTTKLYVYGYVKYGQGHERGFIALYDPTNIPQYGMFERVDDRYPNYARND